MTRKYSSEWFKFLEKIEQFKKDLDLRDNEECFYRGHSNADYQLVPGLFRGVTSARGKLTKELWYAESDMFYEFRSRAKDIHNQNMSDWDILFAMQHHGVKTRLLDWTENLNVAIYFALLNYNHAAPFCIWMLNPYALNEKYYKERDLIDPVNLGYDYNEQEYYNYTDYLLDEKYQSAYDWDAPVAIYPIRLDNRLTSQGGYFTIHGNDVRPLDDIIRNDAKLIRKLSIDSALVPSAELFLSHSGTTHFSVFPDLDGLARHLNSKYFKNK